MRTLLRAATVVDGTERPRYRADVHLDGERIAAIGAPGGPLAGAGRVIEADGLVLAPGFIDMHSHSDLAVLTDPVHLVKLGQGVTTELIGQDGLGYAPVDDGTASALRTALAGWNGDPGDLAWRGVGEYLDRLDAVTPVNLAFLVPHGTVRALVLGWDDVAASAQDIAVMQRVVADALREGAVGMSLGLTYAPGMYARPDELAALCRTVARHGGFVAPHHRSYGAGALQAYAEMLDLARRTGVGLHLAHATMNFASNRGRAAELLALLDAAIADGVDLTLDSYPYLPGATTLAALLPGWASAGGPDAVLRRLRDPAALARVRDELEVRGSDGCHGVAVDWATVEISGVSRPELATAVGRTITELAAAQRTEPFGVAVDLLLRDGLGTGILHHVGDEANVRTIMRHSRHTAGSDGLLVGGRPHPRAWGTFARYLGRYCRELGMFSLEECVGHLSGRPAARLGLRGRGVVAAGAVADLVLFDPATVADRATFERPRQQAAGFPFVFVGGVAVIEGGERSGACPGRVLRRRSGLPRD